MTLFRPRKRLSVVGLIRRGVLRIKVASACASCLAFTPPLDLVDVDGVGRTCPSCAALLAGSFPLLSPEVN